MRLVSLELNGFRGFSKKETFDLDADCVVLVGTNGCGKTTILDGILWTLSGSVSRLGADPAVIRSKYSQSGETQASLTLRDDTTKEEVSITRTLDGDGKLQTSVKIGGKTAKGPSAESRILELLWPDAVSTADSATALASVMACSVYLQQDLVRNFIDSTSDEDRFKAVGELMGAGRVTDLQLRLEKAKIAWSKATNQFQEDLEQLKEKAQALEAQLSDLLERSGGKAGASLEKQWDAWWKGLERYGVKVIPVAFGARDAAAKLDSGMKQLAAFERTAERRLQLLQSIQEDLAGMAARPVVDLGRLTEAVETARRAVTEQRRLVEVEQARIAELRSAQVNLKERNDQLRALAQLAMNLLDEECPVCGQTHDRGATTKRLKKLAANRDEGPKPSSTSEALAQLLNVLTAKERGLSEAQIALRDAERGAKALKDLEQTVARRMKDLGIEGVKGQAERLKATVGAVKEVEQQIDASSTHRASGEALSVHLGQASDQSRLGELKEELGKLKNEIAERDKRIKDRTATGKLGQDIVESLRTAASDVVVRRLDQIRPLLQAVYARIDPHPAFKAVAFLSRLANRRGRLTTVISDMHSKIQSVDPATILSSSQMNALAVSVFLSLNLGSQPPLGAVVLDDPLQSLDDVNLLGLVDLLRRTKEHRQLLVTTHDERFGNLLERKLRPGTNKGRTVVIELGDWTRDGPLVKTRVVKADPRPLRLVAL